MLQRPNCKLCPVLLTVGLNRASSICNKLSVLILTSYTVYSVPSSVNVLLTRYSLSVPSVTQPMGLSPPLRV